MERCLFFRNSNGAIHREGVGFKVPHSWQGATVDQLLASSRAILASSQKDARREVAEWVVKNLGKTK